MVTLVKEEASDQTQNLDLEIEILDTDEVKITVDGETATILSA